MITEEHTDAHKGVVWPTSSFESELWTVLLIGKKKTCYVISQRAAYPGQRGANGEGRREHNWGMEKGARNAKSKLLQKASKTHGTT